MRLLILYKSKLFTWNDIFNANIMEFRRLCLVQNDMNYDSGCLTYQISHLVQQCLLYNGGIHNPSNAEVGIYPEKSVDITAPYVQPSWVTRSLAVDVVLTVV